jgi:autotransporter translocation and assembly factor TamB
MEDRPDIRDSGRTSGDPDAAGPAGRPPFSPAASRGQKRGSGRRGRGARIARGVLLVLACFIIVLLVYALFFSSSTILRYGFSAGNNALADSGFEIKADWVSGRPITALTFGGFEIIHKDEHGEVRRVFSADTLTVKYDVRKLLRKQWCIESVFMANPEILLIRPPEGGVLLPGLKGAGEPGPEAADRRPGGPTVEIRSIELKKATLRVSTKDGEERFEDMDIACSFVRKPSGMTIGLEDASFRMPSRNMEISSTSAQLFYTAGALKIDGGIAHFISSVIDFSGRITFRGETRYDMECRGHPFDVPELAAIFEAKWPEGQLEGQASVLGPADSLAITALVSGNVERCAMKDMRVLALRHPVHFSFSKAEGLVNGARIDASGTLQGDSQTFDVKFLGLDASSGFFPGVAFPATDLSGRAHVRHRSSAAPWEIQAEMGSGQVAEFQFSSLSYKGSVDAAAVVIESVALRRPGMFATANGTVGLGAGAQMSVSFKADIDSVAYPAQWLGARGIDGSLNASGSLKGLSSDPVLQAQGPVAEIRRGPFTLVGGAFTVTVDGLARKGPISFGVSGGKLTAGVESLGRAAVEGVYSGGVLEVPSFSLVEGDSSAAGSFTLKSEDGGFQVEAGALSLSLDGTKWQTQEPFTFSYSSGIYDLRGLRLASDGGALAFSGRLDRSADKVEINLAATGLDMSSFGLLGGKVGGGIVSGQFSLRGPLGSPEGAVQLKWNGVKAFGKEAREVVLRCELREEGLELERLSVDSPVGQALVTGRAQLPGLDLSVVLSGRGSELLHRMRKASLDLSATVRNLDLSWLNEAAGLNRDLAGTLAFSGNVKGSADEPILTFDVDASSLSVAGFSVDACSGEFEYEGGKLRIIKATATKGDVSAGVEGYLPVLMGLSSGVDLEDSEPMALEVNVAPGDFGEVANVWKGFAYSSGMFALEAALTGTPSTPALSGSGWVKGGVLRLAGMEEEYRDVNCRFSLKGNRIQIDDFSGNQGKEGRFSGSGVVTLAWPGVVDYSLSVKLRQFAVLTPRDFDAVLSGDLEVAARPLEDGSLIPMVTGHVNVVEAVFSGRIGAASEFGAETSPSGTVSPSWLANVEIEIPGNVWVSNADAELELAGDVLLIKDFDGLKPRGMLRVVTGKYFLMNTEFNVTTGTITFGKAVGVNPDLDVSAETVIGVSDTGDQETIYVRLTGTAMDPRIAVSSTSGYSETDIYNMLLAGVLWGQGPSEPGGPDISALATNTLFNAIDARLRYLFGSRPPVKLGLKREEGSQNGAGQPETRISVGRNLSRNLFLRYEQGFSAITRREVNLDYRVNRYLLLRSQIINNPDRGVREESSSEINFDIRLRYEF